MTHNIIKKIEKKDIKICIIGLGYVGFPLLELISDKKFNATGYDIDQNKVDSAIKNCLKASTNPDDVLTDADIFIICVPTPVDESHQPDLSYVIEATEQILEYIKPEALVILESTVAPGTTEEIIVPILEKSNYKIGNDILISHCPERIDPGNSKWTVKNIPRVVGGINKDSTEVTELLYTSILDAEVIKLQSVKAAEAVKIVENTFRDVNIAFVNELAKSFDKIGIDITEVIKGASSKPFGFMPHYPGCGVGGHCIAIDPYYLIEKAEKAGFSHEFLKLARQINNSMPDYTVEKVKTVLDKLGKDISGSNITILGLAYKGGVGDTRESPAFPIIEQLENLNANLKIYDPYVLSKSTVKTLDDALINSHCVVIITDHPEFVRIKPLTFVKNKVKSIVDGRNIFDKEDILRTGIFYEGIGR